MSITKTMLDGKILKERNGRIPIEVDGKAKTYLMVLAEGTEEQYGDKYEDLAFKLINHKGKLEELFIIQYEDCWKEKVKAQLGKYSKLERYIMNGEIKNE